MIRRAAPAACVLVASLGLLLAADVPPGTLALYIGYAAAFVVIPGVLVHDLLRGDRANVTERLALGTATGLVLEILAFAATAAAGTRELLALYPPLAIGACLMLLSRAGRLHLRPRAGRLGPGWDWAIAGGTLVLLLYVTLAYTSQTPLPSGTASLSWNIDFVFNLGVAADALHHWPIGDPHIAGEPLPYHTFANVHAAATAQVTGIDLPLVFFRFHVLPLTVLAVTLLGLAARAAGGRWPSAVVAMGLFFLVGEIDPEPAAQLPFSNSIFLSVHTSPSFLLGLVFFLAMLVVLLSAPSRGGLGQGGRALLLILLIGCAGAKASILPVTALGCGLHVIAGRALGRELDRDVAFASIASIAVMAVAALTLYAGGESGFSLGPFEGIRALPPIAAVESRVEDVPILGLLGPVIAVVFAIVGFAAPSLAGLALLSRAGRPDPRTILLSSLLLAGALPWLLIDSDAYNQNWFVYYGMAAGCVLAGIAFDGALVRAEQAGARHTGIAAAGIALAGAAIGLLWMELGLAGYESTRSAGYITVSVGTLALALGVLVLVAARLTRARTGGIAVLVTAAVASLGLLDAPVDTVPVLDSRRDAGVPLHALDRPFDRGVTTDLTSGLEWIRRNTQTNDRLAVSNPFLDEGSRGPGYMYYSALAQRRVFLEGWGYAVRTTKIGFSDVVSGREHPFPERAELNDAVFADADRRALRVLTGRHGVRYLVVDLLHGGATPGVVGLGRVVYRNPAVIVLAVGPGSNSGEAKSTN